MYVLLYGYWDKCSSIHWNFLVRSLNTSLTCCMWTTHNPLWCILSQQRWPLSCKDNVRINSMIQRDMQKVAFKSWQDVFKSQNFHTTKFELEIQSTLVHGTWVILHACHSSTKMVKASTMSNRVHQHRQMPTIRIQAGNLHLSIVRQSP